MELPSCYLEVEIIHKDGTKEFVSPILHTNESILIEDDYIEILNNSRYTYTFDKDNIAQLNIVAIFDHYVAAREKIY